MFNWIKRVHQFFVYSSASLSFIFPTPDGLVFSAIGLGVGQAGRLIDSQLQLKNDFFFILLHFLIKYYGPLKVIC